MATYRNWILILALAGNAFGQIRTSRLTVTNGGSIDLWNLSAQIAKIQATTTDGIIFSTKTSVGALTQRWQIDDDGMLLPWADNTYAIGSAIKRVSGFHAMAGDLYGPLTLNNSALSIKTSGGLQRAGFDINGFTLYSSIGVPTVIVASASGTIAATNVGAINLSTTNVVSNLIPDGAFTLGDNANRWEAWLSNVSANDIAVAANLTVGGTLTAGTFSPATIVTTNLTATTISLGGGGAVNTDWIPGGATGTLDLGSTAAAWADIHTKGNTRIQYPGDFSLMNAAETVYRIRGYQTESFGLNWGTFEVYGNGVATITLQGLNGSVNAASFSAGGTAGITGSCATTVVYVGGIVTGCI